MHAPLRGLAALPLLVVAACGGGESAEPGPATSSTTPAEAAAGPPLPQKDEPFELDPADFVDTIDNPYWPMTAGSRWVYRETDAGGTVQQVVVTVTDRTKTIDGIRATVVRDTVTEDGELVEDTFDWFSQHEDGTVWYLGELSQEFEDGELVSLEGSWQAGEDGGLPGIVMPARPALGMTYRQELLLTVAEDAATVTSLDAKVRVPFGTFQGCLETSDFTPLEPEVLERKYYAPGIGLVLEVDAETGERTELVAFTPGP